MGLASILGGAAFYLALIVNADYVRTLVQPDFDFGEREMLGVLASINRTKTWRFEQRSSQFELDVHLRQVPGADVLRRVTAVESPVRTFAHACGSRTFRQTASACLDTTGVPIAGKVALRRRTEGASTALLEATVTGDLQAAGRHLGQVVLRLRRDVAEGASAVGRDYIELQSRDARSFGVELVRLRPEVDFYAHAL